MASLTWLGHASFRLDTSDGKRIYVDPWLSGPTTPDSEKEPERADAIAVTHGHGDHAADVAGLQQKLGCTVLGMVELMAWYSANGIDEANLIAFNKGGTVEVAGVRFTMTNAFHSSSAPDLTYTGEAAGFVVFADDARIYFAGRHDRLRRHAADRAPLRADGRRAADRRPLHDGPEGGGTRARAARQPALRARVTGAPSRCSPARRPRWRR